MNVSMINPQLRDTIWSAQAEELGKLETMLKQMLRDKSDNLDALYGMGLIFLRTGRIEDAKPLFLKILKTLHPSASAILEVRAILAQIFNNLKDFTSAIPHLKYVLDRKPNNPEVYVSLCHSYHQIDDFENVKKYLRLGLQNAHKCFQYQPGLVPILTIDQQRVIDAFMDFNYRHEFYVTNGGQLKLITWAPVSITDTSAKLRGTTRILEKGIIPEFEISQTDHADGDESQVVRYKALPFNEQYENTNGIVIWQATARNLKPGHSYQYRLILTVEAGVVMGEPQIFTTKSLSKPDVVTGSASLVGIGGVVINGTVGNTTIPTTYFFKYGYTPDCLECKTLTQTLPPPRTGRTKDIVSHVHGHLTYYTLEMGVSTVKPSHMHLSNPEPAPNIPPDLAIRITTPFGKDRNHMNGIGVADLVMGWYSTVENPDEAMWEYPGRTVDLRDAEIELNIRCHELDPRDFYFNVCCQTYLDTACTDHMEDTANWCLTGQMTDMRDLADGNWHILRYHFRNDSEDWTYAGNNTEEQGERANRYSYRHIGEVLTNHRGNIAFWFVFGNERDTCEGALDVYSISLRYRDGSLLSPGWSARLISWPACAVIDPARLTNGWRGNPDQFWMSGPNPTEPQKFVWDFGDIVKIQTVRLHQNTLYPAKDLKLSGSMDGERFEPICAITLPRKKGQGAAHSRTFRLLDSPVTLRYLKLAIISGYQPEFWGLDAIEVFGDAGPPSPEVEPCSVSEELNNLVPGKTLYYQLVAENESGTTYGEIRSIELPSDLRPIIHWVKVLKQDGGKVTLLVRLSGMGHETQLQGWFKNQEGELLEGPYLTTKCQPVPKHITYVISCPDKPTQWQGRLLAVSEAGQSSEIEVSWEIPATPTRDFNESSVAI